MNLHLTGDFHAITAAHNLLSAMIDNHLHHGNDLDIDERTITWPRVLDVNDRACATSSPAWGHDQRRHQAGLLRHHPGKRAHGHHVVGH